MRDDEEKHAYAVLGLHFGCSPSYIKAVLELHFNTASDAGNEHMTQQGPMQEQNTSDSTAWSQDDIRDTLALIDKLRAKGIIPPLQSVIQMHTLRRNKKGKVYFASDEQLQQELALQSNTSIDADGNLVQNGQIVKLGWLQSFAKKDYG